MLIVYLPCWNISSVIAETCWFCSLYKLELDLAYSKFSIINYWMNEEIKEEWTSYFMYFLSYENIESGQVGLFKVFMLHNILFISFPIALIPDTNPFLLSFSHYIPER